MVQKNLPDSSRFEAGSKERIAADQISAYEIQLRNMLYAEKALLRFVPTMMESTTSQPLNDMLRAYHKQIKGHVISLESVFKTVRIHPESLKDAQTDSLLSESEQGMKNTRHGVRDTQIVESLIKINKHKEDAYMAVSEIAKAMGLNDSVRLLQEMSTNEKNKAEEVKALQIES